MTTQVNATLVAQRLNAGAAALQEINAGMEEAIAAMRRGKLTDACIGYKSMNDAYEALDEQRKELFKQLESMSRGTIPEMLADEDVTNVTIQIGDTKHRFGKNQRVSTSMLDPVAGMEWLRTNGGEGIIKETVHSGTLSTFAKDYVKETGKDLPVDYFKTSTMVYTSITKAK